MKGVFAGTRLWLAGAAVLPVGCGFVVDADRFRAASARANEPSIAPTELYEGAGGRARIGAGVPMYIRGRFGDTTRVEVDDPRLTLGRPIVADDGSALAVQCWVAPFRDLPRGRTATVTVTVIDGENRNALGLTIIGLDELELSGSVATRDLQPLYSSVVVTAETVLTGTLAARLVSTGTVDIAFGLSASGEGRLAGPGGSDGGRRGRNGEGTRAGAGGDRVSEGCAGGGAGAGASEVGDNGGGGAIGGAMGADAPTRVIGLGGHGGGSGGRSGDTRGGHGGGGGGVVWLEGPDVRIDGAVLATGGDGEGAPRQNCGDDAPGAGGGGSGGTVLVRATGAFEGTGRLAVSGGLGGAGPGRTRGGAGADGWIRIDAPAVPTALVLESSPWRGPSWTTSDVIVDQGAVLGFKTAAYDEVETTVRVDGKIATTLPSVDSNGNGTWGVPEQSGLHELCVVIAEGFGEGQTCISVAVLP